MPEYKDMSIEQLRKYAERSSGELASLGDGRLMNYENGEIADDLVDEDTALFIASARSIVLELVSRLQESESHTEFFDHFVRARDIHIMKHIPNHRQEFFGIKMIERWEMLNRLKDEGRG